MISFWLLWLYVVLGCVWVATAWLAGLVFTHAVANTDEPGAVGALILSLTWISLSITSWLYLIAVHMAHP